MLIVIVWITCRAVGSLRNIHQVGGTFPLHANRLIMSFYRTVPTLFAELWNFPLNFGFPFLDPFPYCT